MSVLLWILIASACAVLEMLLSSFWFIWLAVAGLCTALLVKFGLIPGMTNQLLAFSAFAAIFLFFVRPIVLRLLKNRKPKS